MRRNARFGKLVLWLAVGGAPAAQDALPATQIAWEPDFDGAFAKAEKEGRPLMVAFIMDGESANDLTVRRHYKDPEVVALSRKIVCLVGSLGDHGSGDGPCPRFGVITCAQHREVEKKARERFMKTDVVRAPQHVFCAPNGVEVLRKVYLIPELELRKSMEYALGAKPGEGEHDLVAAERVRVDQLLEDADSTNAEVREAAFAALAASDDARAVPALLQRAKPSNKKPVRYAAIRSLGIKGNYKAVVPLVGFLRDRDARVLMLAAMALERIELPDPVPDLLERLKKEKRDRVRACLLRAAAKCHPESEAVQEKCLQAMRRPSKQLVDPCLIALFHLPPDPRIRAAVERHVRAKNMNTRALALWVLGRQRQPELVAVIEEAAAREKTPEVKALAAKAVAYCRGEDVANYDTLYRSFYYDGDNL